MKIVKRLLGLAASAALALTMVSLPASATPAVMNFAFADGGGNILNGIDITATVASGTSTQPGTVTRKSDGTYTSVNQIEDSATYNLTITNSTVTAIGSTSKTPPVPLNNFSFPSLTGISGGTLVNGGRITAPAATNMTITAWVAPGVNESITTVTAKVGSASAVAMNNTTIKNGKYIKYELNNVTGGELCTIEVTGSNGNTVNEKLGIYGGQSTYLDLPNSGSGGDTSTGVGSLTVNLNNRVNTGSYETPVVTLSGNGQVTQTRTATFTAGSSFASVNFPNVPTGNYTVSATYGGQYYSQNTYVNSTTANAVNLNGGTNANSSLSVTVYNNNGSVVGSGANVYLRTGSQSGTTMASSTTDIYGKVVFSSSSISNFNGAGTYYVTTDYGYNTVYMDANRNFSVSAISVGYGSNGTSTSASMSGTGYRSSSTSYSGSANISLTTNSNPVVGTWDIRLTNSSTNATSYSVGSGSVYVNNNTSSYTYSTTISVSTSSPTIYMWYKAPTSSDYSYGGSFSMSGYYYNNIPEDNIFNNNTTSGTPAAAAASINRNSTAKLGKYSGVTFTATNSGTTVTSSDVQEAMGIINSVSYNSADLPAAARSAISKLLNANTKSYVNSPATARPLFFTDDTTGGTKFPFNLIVSMPITESMASANPTLFRYKNGGIQKMTTEVRVSGNTASFAINDTSVYFLATGITSVDLAAGEGTVDSNEDITVDETTAPEETMAPVVTDAPVVMETTTAAAVNPSTGNAPIALVIIPVALAAACVIAKRTK